MGDLRDYLQLFRAQTAAVEGGGFPLAAWIGGAPLWILPAFALLGVLAHFAGFGMNGLTDLDYDRYDPAKADHPLVTGRIHPADGWFVVGLMMVLGLLLFVALVGSGDAQSPRVALPIAMWGGYIGLGWSYNLFGKRNKPAAVLEISGAFALSFLACGMAWTGDPNLLVWSVTFFVGVYVAYQIAVLGEGKELGQRNERNILRWLGASVIMGPAVSDMPVLRTSRDAWVFSHVLSAAKAVAVGTVAMVAFGPCWGLTVGAVSAAVFAAFTVRFLRSGPWNRARRVRIAGLSEAVGYLLLVLALVPILWPWLWEFFVALPVLWFVGLNAGLWPKSGSAWAPGV